MKKKIANEKFIRDNLDNIRVSHVNKDFLEKEIFFISRRENFFSYLQELLLNKNKIENRHNSSLLYCLGLTEKKPNTSVDVADLMYPDIDIDIQNRKLVNEILENEFSINNIVYINTQNTLKCKGAVQETLRAHSEELKAIFSDWNPQRVISISKLFSLKKEVMENEVSYFERSIKEVSELKEFFENKDIISLKLEDQIKSLIGYVKSTSIHPSGVIGSSVSIQDKITFSREKHNSQELNVADISMHTLEALGFLKFDFLTLTTISQVEKCLNYIFENHGKRIDIEKINFEDPKVFDSFLTGKTSSTFQMGSSWFKDYLTQLDSISSIEELAIILAILRTGPIKMGTHTEYLERRSGNKSVSYLHKDIEDILESTYGLIVFQEQIMKIVQVLANFTGEQSVKIVKYMSKKNKKELISYKQLFITNTIAKYPELKESDIEDLWNSLESFGEYGFGFGHAIAYAKFSYLNMFLQVYFTKEWARAVLDYTSRGALSKYYKDFKNIIQLPKYLCHEVFDDKFLNLDNGFLPNSIYQRLKDIKSKNIFSIIKEAELSLKEIGTLIQAHYFDSLVPNFLYRVENNKSNYKELKNIDDENVFFYTSKKFLWVFSYSIEVEKYKDDIVDLPLEKFRVLLINIFQNLYNFIYKKDEKILQENELLVIDNLYSLESLEIKDFVDEYLNTSKDLGSLNNKDNFSAYIFLDSAKKKSGKRGEYLSITCKDDFGKIYCNIYDDKVISKFESMKNQALIFKIEGSVNEWNSFKSVIIKNIEIIQ